MKRIMKRTRLISLFSLISAPALIPAPARADNAGPTAVQATSGPDGHAIFTNICQACHMPDGKGATGAATIPALAGNPKLESPAYPISVVLYGYGAMAALGARLNDDQIAAVLTHVRSNFGNQFTDPVTAADVAASRIPGRAYSADR